AHAGGALLVGQDTQRPRRPRRRRQSLYRGDPRLAADQLGARRGGRARPLAGGAEEAGGRLPDPGRVFAALSQGPRQRGEPRGRHPHPGEVRGLETTAREVLDRRLLPESPRPVAVAFSGGGDSLALVLIADGWAREAGRKLVILTVDHGLQA